MSGVVAVLLAALVGGHLIAESIGQSRDLLGRITDLGYLARTGDVYLPFGNQAFTYPPGAIFLFWPLRFVPVAELSPLWDFVSLAALAGAITAVYRFLWRPSALVTIAAACWTTAAAVVVLDPVHECLGWGQTSTILLCLVTVDYLVLRGGSQGVLVGLATAFKIYPGIFILVWLWRRQWRPALTALGTVLPITGLACALWPHSAHTYFTSVIFGGGELVKFGVKDLGTGSSSFLTVLTGWPFPNRALGVGEMVVASASLVVVGLLAVHLTWRRGYVLSSFVLGMIVSAVAAPVAWDHYFTFAPLLMLMGFELGWRSVLARTGAFACLVLMVPWHRFRTPYPGHWWSGAVYFGAREAVILTMLAVLMSAFFDAWLARRATRRCASVHQLRTSDRLLP